MKENIMEFIRRGLIACGFGPIILAVLYLILYRTGEIEALTVEQVCRGIFSLAALAFIVGGMNVLYQVEQLPLMAAILLHGSVLYVCYMTTYLFNGWLTWGIAPILVFTGIFVLGYLVIWAVIYTVTKVRTAQLNDMLKKMQPSTENS